MIVEYQIPKGVTVVRVKLTKAGEERFRRLSAEKKCLACEVPFKPGETTTRGCHLSCDQTQRYAMRMGKETDQSLVKRGERAPRKTGGRPPASAYAARLLGREGEEAKT